MRISGQFRFTIRKRLATRRLVALPSWIIDIAVVDLGMAVQKDGQQGAEETGRAGRRPVDVFVDAGPADVVVHQILLHGY